MAITVKNSELAHSQQAIGPAITKIAQMENLDNDLKSKVAKSLKEFKKSIKQMGENFQTILDKYQDGFDEQGRPKIKEGSEDEFKKEQVEYGEITRIMQCNQLDSKLLLGIDGISASDVVNLGFLSDFE